MRKAAATRLSMGVACSHWCWSFAAWNSSRPTCVRKPGRLHQSSWFEGRVDTRRGLGANSAADSERMTDNAKSSDADSAPCIALFCLFVDCLHSGVHRLYSRSPRHVQFCSSTLYAISSWTDDLTSSAGDVSGCDLYMTGLWWVIPTSPRCRNTLRTTAPPLHPPCQQQQCVAFSTLTSIFDRHLYGRGWRAPGWLTYIKYRRQCAEGYTHTVNSWPCCRV